MTTDAQGSAPAGDRPEHRGHDVFVSYARADRDVVVALNDGLAARGKRAWIDLEDIPPSAEWMAEIRRAIDAADGYLVIVSPDLAASKVCGQELDHAKQNGKRVVPVLVRPTDPASVPDALAALNWIDATGGLDPALDRMVSALETDLGHVRTHSRLLVRAREWEARGSDRSLLLRGSDLAEAEGFLVQGQGKEPAPTTDQARFIAASRQATSRRQRMVIGAIAIALVISLGLAAFAVIQRGEALEQREAAEAQRRVAIEQRDLARSGDLSSASARERQRDPELALLLAIEAGKIMHTDRTEEALREAVLEADLQLVRESGEGPGDLAFGPDGTWVASHDRDSIDTWDATTGGTILSIPMGEGERVPWSLAVDPRGRWIATAASGGTSIWDATTGELLRTLPAKGIVFQVEFSTDGDQLVAGGDDGARLWDPATGEILLELGREESGTYGADISPDGSLIATGHGDGIVRVWDGRTGRLEHELRGHSDLGFFVGFSRDGDRLVSIAFDRTARIWDARTGEQLAVLAHDTFVQDAAFIRDDFVITGDTVGVMRVWDVSTGETVSELRGHDGQITFLAVNPQQDRVASASDDGSFRLWRLGPGVSSVDVDRPQFQTVAAYRPDGEAFLTAGYSSSIELWDATSGAKIGVLSVGRGEASARSVAFSPDGSTVAVGARLGDPSDDDNSGTVMLMDASTGELIWDDPESGGEAPASVGFSPDGQRVVAVWTDGVVRVHEARDGAIDAAYEPEHEAKNVGSGPSLAAFSPDGRMIAVVDGTDVVLWDPEDGTVSRTLGHVDPVRAIAFSPDGRSLVTGSSDSTIRLWDVLDGSLEATLTGHKGPIWSVAFSPNGRFIVSAAQDGTARVWDRAGELLQVYRAGELFVTSAMFSPTGSQILVGVVVGEDTVPDVVEHDVQVRSTTRIYRCEVCLSFDELLAFAESRVTRELTPEERATYLGEGA